MHTTILRTAMQPQPLYQPHHVHPAFELRYSWTGWPARSPFDEDAAVLTEVSPLWETDGMRLLERYWSNDRVQLTFSTTPEVSPSFLAGRAKGRLQHALASQVARTRFADPSFRALMKEFTIVCDGVDLSGPTESAHGRYWYNLHVVLVTAERYRVVDRPRLTILRDHSLKIAEKKGYRISRLSVMPDHLHVSLRGSIQHGPREIALAFQNNLAYALGQVRIWADTFYVGTFGEYDMRAIRRNESPH